MTARTARLSDVIFPRVAFVLAALAFAPRLGAQAAVIPAAEAAQPPTTARLAAMAAAAQRDGWAPQAAMIRATAIRAYHLDRLPAAEAWFNVYRWAALFVRRRRGSFRGGFGRWKRRAWPIRTCRCTMK